MRKIFLPLLSMLLLSSCATILKRKTYKINVSTNEVKAKVKVYDTIYDLPNKILVRRSNKQLALTLLNGRDTIEYAVKPSPNRTFLFMNLVGIQAAPLYYAIDFTNQKRFTYGSKIYLNSNDSLHTIKTAPAKNFVSYFGRKLPRSRGDINLTVAVPFINQYYLKPQNFGHQSSATFFGLSVGADYFYSPTKFIAINATATLDSPLPFPVPLDYFGPRERFSSKYICLTDNFKLGRISIGYGINYAHNKWIYSDDYTFDQNFKIERTSKSLGITTNAYFQLNKLLYFGIVYRPSLLTIKPRSGFNYEHLISYNVMIKIPVKKK